MICQLRQKFNIREGCNTLSNNYYINKGDYNSRKDIPCSSSKLIDGRMYYNRYKKWILLSSIANLFLVKTD